MPRQDDRFDHLAIFDRLSAPSEGNGERRRRTPRGRCCRRARRSRSALGRLRRRLANAIRQGVGVARRTGTAIRSATRDGFTANGPVSAAAAVLVFVIVATHGQVGRVDADAPGAEVAAGTVAMGPDLAGFGRLSAGLQDPTLSDERRIAAVDALARDPRDGAIDVLLAAAESPSVVVSMASVRALRGRPCARVGPLLVRRLSEEAWQRRAWAAKVLGENGCVAAAPDLRRRLRNERDPRVRAQLATALATISHGTAG